MFSKNSFELSTFIYNDRDIKSAAGKLSFLGINQIELFGADNLHWRRGDNAENVKSVLDSNCISSHSMHLTVAPLTDAEKSEQAMNDMFECIEFARVTGSSKAVMHAGLIGPALNTEKNRDKLASCLVKIAQRAYDCGIKLLIENLPDYGRGVYGATFDDLLDLSARAGDKNIWFCYDVGHANVNSQDIFGDFAKSCGRIEAVHLSDNRGMVSSDNRYNDAHLPPFDGNLPWNELFKLFFSYSANLTMTLEVSNRASEDSREEILRRTYISVNTILEPYKIRLDNYFTGENR